MHSTEFRPPM